MMSFVRDTFPAGLPSQQAPADDRGRYLRPLIVGRKRIKYNILTALWIAAALWFWVWWLQPHHFAGKPQFWALTAGVGYLFFLQGLFMAMFRRAHVPAATPPDPAVTRVAMVVTKTPGEPLALLQTTLRAMLAQDYPCDVWLADEDPSPETMVWCAENNVRISTRKGRADYHRKEWPRRTRCKEGNLAFFYDQFGYDNYDFVSQLDADHVPAPSYLTEIMRGFADPAVGYVSAPSICSKNAATSWAARSRMDTEAAFHGIIQSGYTVAAAPMCFGSHYAVRTRALRAVGGLGPELAEDHSTTMIMNSGGWRGVHAPDAIAIGDGPETVADLCTQEFQWSRSLMTLLLRYTPRYLAGLTPRLRVHFLFCQSLYPMIGVFMLALYLLPIVALLFDVRFAEVTYPVFLLHFVPAGVVLYLPATLIRAEGHFRPATSHVFSWERALFQALQWPWVLWGCIMAVRDRLFGGFVDFRITPKGSAMAPPLPVKVLLPYVVLACAAIVPVLLVGSLKDAPGFLILSVLNGALYVVAVAVIVRQHYRENRVDWTVARVPAFLQYVTAMVLAGLLVSAFYTRGKEGLHALTVGLHPVQIIKIEFRVAGAGFGADDGIVYVFAPAILRDDPRTQEE